MLLYYPHLFPLLFTHPIPTPVSPFLHYALLPIVRRDIYELVSCLHQIGHMLSFSFNHSISRPIPPTIPCSIPGSSVDERSSSVGFFIESRKKLPVISTILLFSYFWLLISHMPFLSCPLKHPLSNPPHHWWVPGHKGSLRSAKWPQSHHRHSGCCGCCCSPHLSR